MTSLTLIFALTAAADVETPAIFGPNMVLQQKQANPVWGWAAPGEKVAVSFAGQSHSAVADDKGAWKVVLEPMPANATPQTMTIKGSNTLTYGNVLVGEVWVCSGQSNMQWSVRQSSDADLESLTAKYPRIRLISVPQVGTQEPQKDFKGAWAECTPQTAPDFSAVGFYFGRQLHRTLDVPVGLIDNAWGGSACEAWIPRDVLTSAGKYGPLLEQWDKLAEEYDIGSQKAAYEKRLEQWKKAVEKAKAAGRPVPRRPRAPRNPLSGQHRPANLYNGVLKPIMGYGIRGAIWYQGESNASRAYQYRTLFPLMIRTWRDHWNQKGNKDFSFYWVQLADFRDEVAEPAESSWAELREAQTMTLDRLANVGEAVIIDLGEGRDIHPRNKQGVANRLARWALAKDYGLQIAHRSPRFKSMEIKGDRAILTFDHVGSGIYAFDTRDARGFAVAGGDRKFHWARGKIVGKDRIEVRCEQVQAPVAVRYAWAENPVCNVQSREGLPLTPFRTDDWKGITVGKHTR